MQGKYAEAKLRRIEQFGFGLNLLFFFYFFFYLFSFLSFLLATSSCRFFLFFFSCFLFFLLKRMPNLRYLTFEKRQKCPQKRFKRKRLEVPFHTKARTNHPAGIAAEVVADFYLATNAEVLAAEVLANVVPELWLCGEDGVLRSIGYFAILVELHVSVLVKHTCVVLPPEISEAAKVQTL